MIKSKRELVHKQHANSLRNQIFSQKRTLHRECLEHVDENTFLEIQRKQAESDHYSAHLIRDGYIGKCAQYIDAYPELVLSTLIDCTFHPLATDDVKALLDAIFNHIHHEDALIILNNLAFKGHANLIVDCGLVNEFAAVMEQCPQHQEPICRILSYIDGQDDTKVWLSLWHSFLVLHFEANQGQILALLLGLPLDGPAKTQRKPET